MSSLSKEPPELAPRGVASVPPPKQARSQRTLERLLDAAEQLIVEQGAVDVSVPDIVARAGSSVGGFYARFKDKDALLCALEERFLEQMKQRVTLFTAPERWRGAQLHELLFGLMQVVVETYTSHGRLLRVFAVRAARSQQVWRDGQRLRSSVIERVVALGLEHRDQIKHPDPAQALELGLLMVFGVLQQKAIWGEVRVRKAPLKDSELVSEFTRMFAAYLRLENYPRGNAG